MRVVVFQLMSVANKGSRRLPWENSTLAPRFLAFCFATVRAGSEMSDAKTFASGSSRARVIAIHPEPVPMSIIGVSV